MNSSEVLLAAANRIEQKGWWQKGSLTSGHCAYTALAAACTGGYSFKSVLRLAQYLKVSWWNVDAILEWNDTPGRSKEEVITALRNAALPRRQWRQARRQAQLILVA